MEKENLIIKLQKALKLSGFNIRREFSSHLIDQFLEAEIDLNSRPIFLENVNKITKTLGNLCSAGRSIEKEHVERVLEICLHSGYDKNETILNVISAFDFPKLLYNVDRNIYSINNNEKSKLLADPSAKSTMFLERYERILQRTKRTILASNNNNAQEKINLQTVDYLLTLSEITLEKTLILGSLLQISGGKFMLEDPTGSVELNLTHAKYHTGFYAENSIILVNGYYSDKILHASTILMPNGEESQSSRLTFGNLNYFGGNSKVLLKDSMRLKQHLEKNEKDPFVFLSDVWLDNPETFLRLETLFAQMEEYLPPIAFVFLGNFMERPENNNDNIQEFKKLFRKLGKLIKKFNLLCELSKFIFVPGLEDPSTPNIIPRFALPKFISEEIPNGIFTTNPCRIQYCNKEIVVFRADLLTKFLHSSLHKPQKHDITRSISKTIIGQGHLCPFSLTVFNIFWDFDYCMSLYPLPDLIVLGDKAEPYKDLYKDCLIMNPGQFSANNFTFKVYYPGKNIENIEEILEDCVVRSNTDEEETTTIIVE